MTFLNLLAVFFPTQLKTPFALSATRALCWTTWWPPGSADPSVQSPQPVLVCGVIPLVQDPALAFAECPKALCNCELQLILYFLLDNQCKQGILPDISY